MSLGKISQKADDFLQNQDVTSFEVRRLILLHFYILLIGAIVFFCIGAWLNFFAFILGSFLSFSNFYFLSKFIPVLIREQKRGTFALLVGFYIRLAITGFIFFMALAWLKMPVMSLLIGFSTGFLSVLIWLGKCIVIKKHQEA